MVEKTNSQLFPSGLSDVKAGGEIGRRIQVTIDNNLLKLNVENASVSGVLIYLKLLKMNYLVPGCNILC
jgi:hypothetical protein